MTDEDQAIAKMLRDGVFHREIATALKVSHSQISRVRAEIGMKGQTGGAREVEQPPPHVNRKAEPGGLSVRVPCIVAGEELGARECIARQCEQKCFCPKASFAINAVTPHVLPGTRLEDQLERCRNVARSVLTKPLEQRFLGPALLAFHGEKVERPLIAGDLPSPPARDPDESFASAFLSRKEVPPPEAKPAPPPEEKPKMAEEQTRKSRLDLISDADLRSKFEATTSLAQLREQIGCGFNVLNSRLTALGLKSSRGAPASVEAVAKKHVEPRKKTPPAPPMIPPERSVAHNGVDILTLLEQQHAHHSRELGRISKALAAMRE